MIADGAADPDRAARAMARLRALRLSKYNAAPDLASPPQGHVLVIDQTRGDASITRGGADAARFARMLDAAKSDHPGADIIIKTHPETQSGRKPGHFGAADGGGRVRVMTGPANPWSLTEGAAAVYTVTSQMGFEALLAGRPVRCFGTPFYAGWGATEDETPVPRRAARRSPAEIFDAAYLRYPVYFDPWRGDLISCEAAMEALAHLRDARLGDPAPSTVAGARLWKRRHIAAFLDRPGAATTFEDDPVRASSKARARVGRVVVWAGKETEAHRVAAGQTPLWRLEDGFLRSAGLGAALTPPLSLALDDLGIYYDPRRESRLERLIAAAPDDQAAMARAAALRRRIVDLNVTKYNLTGAPAVAAPDDGRLRILAPGQVEDDASILCGATAVRTNADLIRAARAAAPDAWIAYKPHPDVEAGLRPGAVPPDALALADCVLTGVPAHAALDAVDEVWTITSLIGFEALMRGKPVTTFGAPFYAGWGLTTDRGDPPARRTARPTLDQLTHAALISYPLYRDPVSGAPCPPEVIVERLAAGRGASAGFGGGLLAKAQGVFASYAHLWR